MSFVREFRKFAIKGNVVDLAVKVINRLRREEPAAAVAPPPPREEILLEEIRDLLRGRPA